MDFGAVDLAAARRWFDAAKEGVDVVSVQQRNGAVAVLAGLCDVLADPERVLGAGGVEAARFPSVPYRGADAGLRGRDVALVGGIEPPAWWRTGAAAPSTLAPWLRASDGQRRALYGALSWVLTELGRTGERNPQQGTQANRTSGSPLLVLGAVAVVGLGAWAWIHEVGDTARTFLRERGEVHRFAAHAETVVKLYMERLRVARETGTMPPPSPAETALNPYDANGRPASTSSPSGRGLSWWDSLGGDALKVGGVALGVSAAAGFLAWAWNRWKASQAPLMAPQSNEGMRGPPGQGAEVW